MSSSFILWIQQRLADELGIPVPVTGTLTAATRRALRIFQQRMGLPVTGNITGSTLRALKTAARPGTSAGFDDSAAPEGSAWVSTPVGDQDADAPPPTEDSEPTDAGGDGDEAQEYEALSFLKRTTPKKKVQPVACMDDRCTSSYILWMQKSLSKILGGELKPTGKLDGATIAAIARFKKLNGLKTLVIKEYFVGPVIEKTLIAAGAQPPPQLAKALCRASASNQLVAIVNKYRGDIPAEFLMGWIEVESGRQLGSLTSICERGYFQLHPAESIELGVDHDKAGTDADYSVQVGLKLVNRYRSRIDILTRKYGVARNSDLYWRLVKMCHWIPSAPAKIVAMMASQGVAPTTWEQMRAFVRQNTKRLTATIQRDPNDGMRSVDHTFKHVEAWRKQR